MAKPFDAKLLKAKFSRSRPINNLLDQVVKQNGLSQGFSQAKALFVWPEVAGPELAKISQAVAYQNGVMIVNAQDAVVANFLTMQRTMLLERLRQIIGKNGPRDLRFQTGAVMKKKLREERPVFRESPNDFGALISHISDELKVKRENLLKNGFKPCQTCQRLTDESEVCLDCQRLCADIKVLRLKNELMRQPELIDCDYEARSLTEEGLKCAVRLAKIELKNSLQQISLQVLHTNEKFIKQVINQLVLVCKNYLSLALVVPVETINFKDEQILSLLPEVTAGILQNIEQMDR